LIDLRITGGNFSNLFFFFLGVARNENFPLQGEAYQNLVHQLKKKSSGANCTRDHVVSERNPALSMRSVSYKQA